jgi:anti-sigma factor RsiW
MLTTQHPTHLLLAYLDGALAAPERNEVLRHLAACSECDRELGLLREARALVPALRSTEPRPGFAARVAHNAAAAQRSPASDLWRWALGALAAAGVAAVALGVLVKKPEQPSLDMRVAQRLDLYEDMAVMQHQQALEDLDVVAVLHTLHAEARP